MAEVFFYHLTQTPLERVLPDLLERCLQRDWRVCVRGADEKRLSWLDDRIWMHQDEGFLPHGQAGGPHDALQPILLTTGAAANLADVLMLIDGSKPDLAEIADFERVCILFDGNSDTAVDAARGHWKAVAEARLSAQYWAQDDGRWQKKAESKPSA